MFLTQTSICVPAALEATAITSILVLSLIAASLFDSITDWLPSVMEGPMVVITITAAVTDPMIKSAVTMTLSIATSESSKGLAWFLSALGDESVIG